MGNEPNNPVGNKAVYSHFISRDFVSVSVFRSVFRGGGGGRGGEEDVGNYEIGSLCVGVLASFVL